MNTENSDNQMALFGLPEPAKPAPEKSKSKKRPQPKPAAAPSKPAPSPARKKATAKKAAAPAPPRRGSGLVPEGDIRLTANIREDLHLRLKIAAARQRTTIGEIIEELVEKYV
ncbi:plasmid partition protein ParG [Trichloromonas sp.]|uniref:plasmid partition protein ParG n=1 Tax=Trichloromonas sp. TaxID=3069249 RepID=UPI003D817972